MSVEIKLPNLGEGIESGDVLEVFVKEGDEIQKDDGVCELETDKATVTVPAEQAGTVVKVHISEGDAVPVGATLVTIEPSGGAATQSESAAAEPAQQESSPALETPAPVEPAVQAEPVVPPKAPAQPVPAVPPVEPVPAVAAVPPTQPTATGDSSMSTVPAGPAVRRFAREVGVDLRSVSGSGQHGRITRDDVLKVVRDGNRNGSSVGTAAPASGQTDAYGSVRIEKMPKIRQTIARKMHESWETVPRVTNFDDADVTDLEKIRQNSKKEYASEGVKLTTMPFVIKAVAMALKANPVINASVDLDQGQIIYKDYVNVGIAVDTDRGLVVPSLRNVDKLAIPNIARELGKMAENVRGNNFKIEDLRGGTFTISNLGAIGGTYSTPIINTPETAILLVGRSRKMPVVVDDQIAVRLMMPLSLSYDHRLIDGGAAARFLNDVIGYLEAPSRLLLAL